MTKRSPDSLRAKYEASQRARQPSPNSICPLPLFGWKPSTIAGPDGQPPQPPLVLCMGAACAWYVMVAPDRGVCAPSALAVVTSNLPAAVDHYVGQRLADEAGPPAERPGLEGAQATDGGADGAANGASDNNGAPPAPAAPAAPTAEG